MEHVAIHPPALREPYQRPRYLHIMAVLKGQARDSIGLLTGLLEMEVPKAALLVLNLGERHKWFLLHKRPVHVSVA